jgi:hypothetical protein
MQPPREGEIKGRQHGADHTLTMPLAIAFVWQAMG